MKVFLLACLTLISSVSFAHDIKPDNFLLRDGIYSPVYGEIGGQISNEYGDWNVYLNAQVGAQLFVYENNSLLLGYNKRGFNHGHIGPKNYKLKLDGPVLEYAYKGFCVVPLIGFAWMVGEKRTTLSEQSEDIQDLSRIEARLMLSYKVEHIGGSVVLGYEYSFNQISESNMTLVGSKRVKDKDVGGTMVVTDLGNYKSRSGSYFVGMRFSSY